MSPETLLAGAAWVESRFYSSAATWRRIGRTFAYLRPSVVLGVMTPLSLGYAFRTRAAGAHGAGRRFEPEAASAFPRPGGVPLRTAGSGPASSP